MADLADSSPLDSVANEFTTFEDFLDSQIAPIDLYYLEVRLGKPCEQYNTSYPPCLTTDKVSLVFGHLK